MEYFFDSLKHCEDLYMNPQREFLIEELVQIIKQSNNPRKKHMVENIFFSFHEEYEIEKIIDQYDGLHNWVEEQLSRND